ncbi:MAG: pseudouridine synthase [Pseudomonadota bacterium]
MVHDPLRSDAAGEGQPQDGEGDRIAKVLARSGVGSRRDVERLIAEGRVAINGRTLDTPAVKVEAGDIITVDGEVVGEPEATRLFRYHKPVGLVTTHKDPNGRPTVFKALPEGLPRLISVGRLDVNSEGLLLLTNDGELARALEMPSTGVVRRYRARAHGRTTQEKLDTLKNGITVDGIRYGPVEAKLDKAKEGPQGANLWLTVTLHEGKNREVRRILEALGLQVNRLIRLAYGPLALGTLDVGELEEVGPRVIREQFAEHIDPANLPKGERPQYRSPARKRRRSQQEAEAESLVPVAPREPKGKTEYKAGWAKPKKKARPHPAPKKPAAKAEPTNVIGPHPVGARPGPRPTGGKPGGAKPGVGKAFGPRSTGPRPSRPRPAEGKAEGAKSGGAKFGGTRFGTAKVEGAASNAPRPERARAEGGRPGAKPRPSGSRPAGGPVEGPRGPRPSASPRQTPGARPPGRPKPGGRGPRG